MSVKPPDQQKNDPLRPELVELNRRLAQAIKRGDQKQLENMIRKGADPDLRDENEYTPLHHVVINKKTFVPEVISLLVSHGADVNARNKSGYTPLHYVYRSSRHARALLDAGADVNIRTTTTGMTPLHHALIGGNMDIVSMMLEKKPDVASLDLDGETGEDFAYANEKEDAAQLIEDYKNKFRAAAVIDIHRQNIEKLDRILRRPRNG